MSLAANRKVMVEMAAQIVQRRCFFLRQGRPIEVQAHRPVEIADRAELRIRQIARMRADGKSIRVAGHDWLFRQLRHIPEAPFGQMAHVHEHAEALRAAEKFLEYVQSAAAERGGEEAADMEGKNDG